MLVRSYDPRWPRRFREIEAFLRAGLADLDPAIEHVGSTAIPGMVAKPIIDIDIVIDPGSFPEVRARLEAQGYVHQGDLGIPKREAFDLVDGEARARLPEHHLYVCEDGARELLKHLAFRDFMKRHPQWRESLSRLKLELCAAHENDRQAYMNGKAALVERITRLALEEIDMPGGYAHA